MRAESHLRVGEQWMMADEPQQAADEFTAAIEDGGPTFANPSVYLARALFALGRDQEAERLLAVLTANRESATPRTCDLVAELLMEQGDLRGALEWATAGVEHCVKQADDNELQLLLRLRYRIRVDLGLDEDDYDRMLDATHRQG
jgi:predicted Zn-dependent protease